MYVLSDGLHEHRVWWEEGNPDSSLHVVCEAYRLTETGK